MPYAVQQIAQIAVTVSDVEKALAFYHEQLGLKVLFRPSEQLAFLTDGSIRIMLTTPQGAGAVGANSILYFRVPVIETFYHDLIARGVPGERVPQFTARMPDHELWIGFVKDPDGNLVGLMEEKRAMQAS